MTNKLYNIARFQMVTAAFNWTAFDLALIALRGTPVFNAADVTLTGVLSHGATQAGTSLTVTGKNVLTNGTVQTDPMVIPGITVGPDVTHFVLVKKLSPIGNSVPIEYIDDAVGLPFVPNGLDLTVQPDWLAERGWFLA